MIEDAEAFEAVYRRESEMVIVFVSRRALDAELALDITAETFAIAYRSRRSFRGATEAELRAWILTIARRQLARYLRRGVVERRALERLGAGVPVVHEDDLREIEEAAGLAELRATVAASLERLGGDQREALRLRIVDELPYHEVAAALRVSEQTARARVSRGLRALQRRLDGDTLVRRA